MGQPQALCPHLTSPQEGALGVSPPSVRQGPGKGLRLEAEGALGTQPGCTGEPGQEGQATHCSLAKKMPHRVLTAVSLGDYADTHSDTVKTESEARRPRALCQVGRLWATARGP